ncbi:WD40/YVTN/BNR-like repeat-containing protein [Luteolibacter sp. Populi]|uniref:WD40/YVTN/BNR-like repeat-containing protein n=1 Tax=Luteolibacter sp. Populi TaxID=3230487 RepID=UPI0034677AE6
MTPRAVPLLLLALAGGVFSFSLALPVRGQGWVQTGAQRVLDMASGNGRIISVGTGTQGGVYSSVDGITWTALGGNGRCVCFGGGNFWIVAGDNQLRRINGSAAPSFVASDLFATDIAYGNGLLVATCTGGMAGIYYSSDGLTWYRALVPADVNDADARIHFANGRFVATCGTFVLGSGDGMTWQLHVTSASEPRSIGHGAGGFVVTPRINSTPTSLWKSADGITWSETTGNVLPFPVYAIAFADGKYYAAGAGGRLASSPNATTWTEEDTGIAYTLESIHPFSGMIVAGGSQVIRKAIQVPVSPPQQPLTIRQAVEIQFGTAAGAVYRIEGSANLEDWATLESNISGQGEVIKRFYSTENQPSRYFRVATD